MNAAAPAYGLWTLVVINSVVFIVFALSFATPRTPRDWRSFGAFSGFIVALFAEMYGYPLTIYLLSGWLANRFPGVDFLSHDAGHLLEMMFGSRANPHFGPFHLLSYAFIFGGFWLLAAAWPVLYRNQRQGTLATEGPYARIRHPQYVGFVMIMFGFLLQWPTLLTLAMFPVLCFMYARLARTEEREAESAFGEQWRQYAARTPRSFRDSGGMAHSQGADHGTLTQPLRMEVRPGGRGGLCDLCVGRFPAHANRRCHRAASQTVRDASRFHLDQRRQLPAGRGLHVHICLDIRRLHGLDVQHEPAGQP